jgi:ABC-2 type transport system ATP-binding protein
MEDAVSLAGVSKTFRAGFLMREPRAALKRVDLCVQRGSVFGFLGPNGAGKTTTIKILVGLIAPSSGRVSVFGMDPSDHRTRRRIGYLPENPALPDGLTGVEVLRLMASLSGLSKSKQPGEVARVLRLVDLERAKDVVVRKYSKGMVQRLGIAQALLGSPDLVILDEPMSGLDPVGRREMKDLVLELRRLGKTVFFSTHIISDVEELCDELAIVVQGETVLAGSVARLLGGGTRRVEVLASGVSEDLFQPSSRVGAVAQFLVENESDLRPLIEKLWAQGARVLSVKPVSYGLEDVFAEAMRAGGAPRASRPEVAS